MTSIPGSTDRLFKNRFFGGYALKCHRSVRNSSVQKAIRMGWIVIQMHFWNGNACKPSSFGRTTINPKVTYFPLPFRLVALSLVASLIIHTMRFRNAACCSMKYKLVRNRAKYNNNIVPVAVAGIANGEIFYVIQEQTHAYIICTPIYILYAPVVWHIKALDYTQ